MMYGASNTSTAPCCSERRATAPPRWRISAERIGVPTTCSTKRSIRWPSTSSSMPPSPVPGAGPSGSMCSRLSSATGIVATVSMTGPSARSGSSSRSPSSGSPDQIASTTTKDWPRTGSGISGIGGNWRIRPTERHLVRQVVRPRAPDLQHLGRAIDRVPEDAGVDLLQREEVELDRGDDAEGAAAAAKRPEEVRLVRPVGAHEVSRGGHDLDRRHLVGADAVLPGEPREATAERVADDADIGRGARERGEAVLCRRLDHLDPDHARLDAGDPGVRVDRDLAHPLGLEQDRVVERSERSGAVAGALRCDPEVVGLAAKATTATTSCGALGQRDGGGPLVDASGSRPGERRPRSSSTGPTTSPWCTIAQRGQVEPGLKRSGSQNFAHSCHLRVSAEMVRCGRCPAHRPAGGNPARADRVRREDDPASS